MYKPVVLLVDDEPDILSIYSRKLSESGFEVVTAENGLEALKKARERRPDLVLLDFKMPVMDGIETIEAMKKDESLKDIKVVFLTAFSDPNVPEVDVRFSKQIGADDFIRKGLSLDELVEKVRSHLALPKT